MFKNNKMWFVLSFVLCVFMIYCFSKQDRLAGTITAAVWTLLNVYILIAVLKRKGDNNDS